MTKLKQLTACTALLLASMQASAEYTFFFRKPLPGFEPPMSQAAKESAWGSFATANGYPIPTNWSHGIDWSFTGGTSLSALPDAPYPATSIISGYSLKLSNQNLSDVASLSSITDVGMDLKLDGNDLTSLAGLSSLTTVGWDFDLRRNYNLTNLDGLENLTQVRTMFISFTGVDDVRGIQNLGNFIEIRIADAPVTYKAPMSSPLCVSLQSAPARLQNPTSSGTVDYNYICE